MKKLSLPFVLLAASILWSNASRAEDLAIYSLEEPPTNYTLDGKFSGTTTDIVERLEQSLGLTTKIEVLPPGRAIANTELKSSVLVFSLAKTPAREELGLHFIGPIMTRTHMVWKKKGTLPDVKTLEDAKKQGLKAAGTVGDFRTKIVEDAGVAVETAQSPVLNLKKLLADRIPLMISSNIEMPTVAKLAEADMGQLEPAFTLREASSYVVFSKETDQATIDKWQNAYTALEKTDFLAKTAEKWSGITGANLKFAPEKGFYVP